MKFEHWFWRRIFFNFINVFSLFRNYLDWKAVWPFIWQIWIPLSKWCFVPSLVEIGLVVLEKKMKIWKIYDNWQIVIIKPYLSSVKPKGIKRLLHLCKTCSLTFDLEHVTWTSIEVIYSLMASTVQVWQLSSKGVKRYSAIFAWSTGPKQYPPFFQRGHNKYYNAKCFLMKGKWLLMYFASPISSEAFGSKLNQFTISNISN